MQVNAVQRQSVRRRQAVTGALRPITLDALAALEAGHPLELGLFRRFSGRIDQVYEQ